MVKKTGAVFWQCKHRHFGSHTALACAKRKLNETIAESEPSK